MNGCFSCFLGSLPGLRFVDCQVRDGKVLAGDWPNGFHRSLELGEGGHNLVDGGLVSSGPLAASLNYSVERVGVGERAQTHCGLERSKFQSQIGREEVGVVVGHVSGGGTEGPRY